jgi:hypothetical protein
VIYEELALKFKSSNLALFGTFLVSAVWHGIYLTYYIGKYSLNVGFIEWALLNHISKWVYKMSAKIPLKIKTSRACQVLTFLAITTLINYIGMFMVLLTWENAVQFYSDIYYYGSIVLAILFGLTFIIKPPRSNKKEVNELKK